MPITDALPRVPLGAIKTFGALGPKYEVRRPLRVLDDGDWMIEIVLVESGETTEYRLLTVAVTRLRSPDARC